MGERFSLRRDGPTRPVRRHLLDGGEQPVAVMQHDAVKLLPLALIHGARLQRFQIQPDRRDRRFQFVGDGIDEGIMLFIAADFAHQKESCSERRRR